MCFNISARIFVFVTRHRCDYSQLIKPDWTHAANYKRFNKAVIEMPVDPSAAMAFALKNKTTGQAVYSKENSKTSFILLNDGKGYAA